MRALEFITGHVIYNPAYTYKFQLKTTHFTQKQNKNIVWMKKDLLTIEEDLKLVPRESDSQLVPLVICQVDRERLHSLYHSDIKLKTHSEIAGKK